MVPRSRAAVTSRQAYFIHQSLVSLARLCLQFNEDIADILHDLGADILIEERSSEDLEDESRAANVVGENVL